MGLKSYFNQWLTPTLKDSGFKTVRLKSCISYEELWRKGRLWFGASYDFRDQYLDVNLGRLYWFEDVMPQVVVIGDISESCEFQFSDYLEQHGLEETLKIVASALPEAEKAYETRYDQIYADHPKKFGKRCLRVFLEGLGDEVEFEDLAKYR